MVRDSPRVSFFWDIISQYKQFEVNLFSPEQFGAFIPWLVINRGPLSALLHPNTDDEAEEERNHTQRATWLGEKVVLDVSVFKKGS